MLVSEERHLVDNRFFDLFHRQVFIKTGQDGLALCQAHPSLEGVLQFRHQMILKTKLLRSMILCWRQFRLACLLLIF